MEAAQDDSTSAEVHNAETDVATIAPPRDLSPEDLAWRNLKRLAETKKAISLNRGRPASDKFVKLKLKSPELLMQLSPEEYAQLVSAVVFGADPVWNFRPKQRLETAQLIAATAKELGVTLPPSVNLSLLEAHAMTGNIASFEKLLGEMRDAGADTETPDVLAAQSRVHLVAGDMNKGMQFWSKLAEIDKTKAPHEHLIETHLLRRDVARVERGLLTFISRFVDQLPSDACMDKIMHLIITQREFDTLVRLFKYTESTGLLHASPVSAQAVSALANFGHPQEAITILAIRRRFNIKNGSSHICAEIMAREKLKHNDELPALFASIRDLPAFDFEPEVVAGVILTRQVGRIDASKPIDNLLESHEILSKLDKHVALAMLLRGYTQRQNGPLLLLMFDGLVERRLGIPRSVIGAAFNVVLLNFGPNAAMGLIERMVKAKLPIDEPRFFDMFVAQPIWNKYPLFRPRIEKFHLAAKELIAELQAKKEETRQGDQAFIE
ncbi:hypothetical protein HK105_202521 [Polyrhizophydium stewartii]|uniref:Uncharacterized protein n=1 Tax=Polyrhizophydium stewartii TaxID=2732419 RepID=A0ABR4NF19_9FUNG|nr:hypothetical protein HK105_001494 [Polyrhizophydium stewartii]